MAAIVSWLAVGTVSFVVMEPVTALVHRFVMHGPGIFLHRSHHRNVAHGDTAHLEANDAFPVMFAAIVMTGLALGFNIEALRVLVPIGVGITAYGLAYALVHDVHTHRRLGGTDGRPRPLLDRLAAAHRVHHQRNGAPYGMLLPMMSRSGSRPSHEPEDA